jgi:hypothetical protein
MRRAAVYLLALREADVSSGQIRVMDAATAGTPVVASDVRGLADYVTPGETALTFPAGDAAAARRAVGLLHDDAALGCKLADAAWRRSLAWSRDDYLKAITRLVGRARAYAQEQQCCAEHSSRRSERRPMTRACDTRAVDGDHPPAVHPTQPVDRALWLVKAAIKHLGADDHARSVVARLARPTYRRTLLMIPNREELPALLNARALTGTGVEVGVATGEFSEHILSNWRGKRLVSVDPWQARPPDEYIDVCNTSQESMEASYEAATRRLARFGSRSDIWRLTSNDAAAQMEKHSLDFVYLDARHSYAGVLEDLEAWYPLLRPRAVMAGHDYNDGVFAEGVHGVRSAVDEFFAARNVAVRHTYTDVPSISWIVEIPR